MCRAGIKKMAQEGSEMDSVYMPHISGHIRFHTRAGDDAPLVGSLGEVGDGEVANILRIGPVQIRTIAVHLVGDEHRLAPEGCHGSLCNTGHRKVEK